MNTHRRVEGTTVHAGSPQERAGTKRRPPLARTAARLHRRHWSVMTRATKLNERGRGAAARYPPPRPASMAPPGAVTASAVGPIPPLVWDSWRARVGVAAQVSSSRRGGGARSRQLFPATAAPRRPASAVLPCWWPPRAVGVEVEVEVGLGGGRWRWNVEVEGVGGGGVGGGGGGGGGRCCHGGPREIAHPW